VVTMSPSKLYWICQAAGWGGFVFLNLLFQALAGRSSPRFVAASLVVAAAGLLATHLIRLWIHSHRWLDGTASAISARVAAAALLVGLVIATAGSTVAGWAVQAAHTSHIFLWMTMLGSGVGLAWIALYLAAHALERLERERRRATELAAASREAELQALKAQLDPHFMFNSLNAIRSLIDEDPTRARAAVTSLAEFMRYATTATKSSTVPLAAEIRTVERFLELERVRFEHRLEATVDLEGELGEVPVPPLVLQTLVENAIKHGLSRAAEGGHVRVTVRRSGPDLQLEVANSGSLGQAVESTGIGLANLRQRLELLYGDRSRLDLREQGDEVVSTVVLPTGGALALA